MIDIREGVVADLEGVINEIKWRDTRDGRLAADLELSDGRIVTIAGILGGNPEVGSPVHVHGVFVRDERYGLQFHIEGTVDPELKAASTQAYLGSGLVPYVGASGAAAIVDALGADAIEVALADPDRLLEFRGITKARLGKVRRGLRDTQHLAPIVGLAFLAAERDPKKARRLSISACKRIWRRHGAAAPEIIRANPWRLAREIFGVAFKTADGLARGLGRDFAAPERAEAAVLQALRDGASDEGHITMPENILTAATTALASIEPIAVRAAISRLEAAGEILRTKVPAGLALPRLVAAESLIATKIRSLTSFVDAEAVTIDAAEIDEVEAGQGIVFDPSQRRAIKGSLEEHVTVITGPPGTGKTTIVRAILALAERRGMSIALVSPTGRAAKRLSEATGHPASTIHRWLRYDPPNASFAGPEVLPDLLVVDEASMLDSPLAARLLGPLPAYTRLLLVGDIDQLPAIGPGNVLGDLIASPSVNVFRLATLHRTERGSGIPELANQIRTGVRHPSYDRATTRFVPRETTAEIADWIALRVGQHASRANEIQVLCPMKKGPAGTQALNKRIQDILNPARPGERTLHREGFDLRIGDRILVTGNDKENGIYNGDICYLRAIAEDGELTIDLDGAPKILPPDAGQGFNLGYAMTVHKAQGSEFEVVIIPMHPSAYMLLERRNLYTAVARARRTVAIVGTEKAISMAIGHFEPMARQTLLRGYLDPNAALPLLDAAALADDEEVF